MQADRPPLVIILIHGTYAPKAPWTRPGSMFRNALMEALGSVAAEFDTFDWSAANRHVDRRRAGLRLRQRIRQKLAAHPHASIYLIAHSHGGNIALQVARRFSGEPRLAGVITLATPFLHFKEVPPASTVIPMTFLYATAACLPVAGYWLGMLALLAVSYVIIGPPLLGLLELKAWLYSHLRVCSPLFGSVFCDQLRHGIIFLVSALLALLFVGGLIVAGFRAALAKRTGSLGRWRRIVSRYFYVQPPDSLEQLSVLSLTAPADEALQILNGSWWVHRVSIWAARLIGGAAIGVAVLGLVAVVAGALGWVQANRFVPEQVLMTGLVLCGAFSVAMPFVLIAAALVGQLMNFVGSLPAPALGLGGGARSLLWSVHAHRQLPPSAKHTHHAYGWREMMAGTGFALMHSRLYRSRVAVRDIAEWIAAREATAAIR